MLPVLMYHGLHADPDAKGHFDAIYSVGPDRFASQLDWLAANGYRSIGLDETLEATPDGGDGKRVLITFDDGDVSNRDIGLPLLLERDMRAVFFVTTGFIDQPGMLDRMRLRELADAGMQIGSHGVSHAFLEDLDRAALRCELVDSRSQLEDLTGTRVDSIALPGGRGGKREWREAHALGYRHLFGSEPGPNRPLRRQRWLQRIAITRNTDIDTFAALVAWQGLPPRIARCRHHALALPKHLLGNDRYERLRAKLL